MTWSCPTSCPRPRSPSPPPACPCWATWSSRVPPRWSRPSPPVVTSSPNTPSSAPVAPPSCMSPIISKVSPTIYCFRISLVLSIAAWYIISRKSNLLLGEYIVLAAHWKMSQFYILKYNVLLLGQWFLMIFTWLEIWLLEISYKV